MKPTTDRSGRPVAPGALVRIVAIDPEFVASLPEEERERVASMVGEILPVIEVDDYGHAFVEKEWRMAEGLESHTLALAPHEMELMDGAA